MGRYLTLILKNSWRNKRRTTLTVLSLAASLCLLGMVMAMYRAFYLQKAAPAQALRLITRNRVSLAFPMPLYYREKIRQIPGVREVGVSQWFGGVYKDSRNPQNFFARLAIEPDRIFTLRGEMQVPEDQQRAFRAERTAGMIGRPLAERLGLKLGDRITVVGDIFPIKLELTLRAIYDAPVGSEILYFHWNYLEESVSEGRRRWGLAGMFMILAESPEAVPRIARAVDEMFRNSDVQTKTESAQAFELSFLRFLGDVKAFLLSVSAAVTFTILLVSANTMAMSIRERIHEVGILKTLGFTPRGILGIILGEAALIAVGGGVLGLGLASLLCGVVRNGPLAFDALRNLTVPPVVAVAALVAAAFIGLVSALVPAWSAARIPIIQAIRHTG
jgi:putative ABC transport system permease protein